jgi:hypothetical protein
MSLSSSFYNLHTPQGMLEFKLRLLYIITGAILIGYFILTSSF